MRVGTRQILAIVLSGALVLVLAPASALGTGAGERRESRPRTAAARQRLRNAPARGVRPRSSGVAASFIATWPADAYDLHDPADDTTAGATNLTPFVTGDNPINGWGDAPHEEAHTIATATSDSTLTATDAEADFDWYKFTVTDQDEGKIYLIEAKGTQGHLPDGMPYTDPVIELYGPGLDASPPQDPRSFLETDLVDPNAYLANDNGWWFNPIAMGYGGFSSSLSFIPPEAGEYYFRVRPYFQEIFDEETGEVIERGYTENAGPYTLRIKVGVTTRLAGLTRTDTAVQVSRERYADGELPAMSYSQTSTVIVAAGWNFPDALAASTLAGALNAPILLTPTASLPTAVSDEITRLGAQRVIIVGGDAAVSPGVETQLGGVAGVESVERVEGLNRVQTAAAIADRAYQELGYQGFDADTVPKLAFVVNGYNFPDALSASPMAAGNAAPILLTHPGFLDADTTNMIDNLGITDVVIVGGPSAVGTPVETALRNHLGGQTHVVRIQGVDRYETSRNFAAWATRLGDVTTDTVGTPARPDALFALWTDGLAIATGANFPDALGGGAFAGLASWPGYPLVLTPKSNTPSQWIVNTGGPPLPTGKSSYVDSLPDGPFSVARMYVIGGSSTVSTPCVQTLDYFVGGESIPF